MSMLQLYLLCLVLNVHHTLGKSDEFVCPKDGRWPHPADCEKYYTCNSGISIEGWCGSGMTYDPSNQRCDLSKNIDCQNGERPGWTPPEGWGQSESVTSYIVTKTTTDSHDEFSDEVKEVTKKTRAVKHRKTTTQLVTVASKIARYQATLPITQLQEGSGCAFQGHMPDPDSCPSYYACREDVVVRMRCPDKQLFDDDTRACNDFRKVFCAYRPVNKRGVDPCLGQTNGWYGDQENQCQSYYLCAEQRKAKIGECLAGAKWNAAKLRCDDPRNILAPCGLRTNGGRSWTGHGHLPMAVLLSSLIGFLMR